MIHLSWAQSSVCSKKCTNFLCTINYLKADLSLTELVKGKLVFVHYWLVLTFRSGTGYCAVALLQSSRTQRSKQVLPSVLQSRSELAEDDFDDNDVKLLSKLKGTRIDRCTKRLHWDGSGSQSAVWCSGPISILWINPCEKQMCIMRRRCFDFRFPVNNLLKVFNMNVAIISAKPFCSVSTDGRAVKDWGIWSF